MFDGGGRLTEIVSISAHLNNTAVQWTRTPEGPMEIKVSVIAEHDMQIESIKNIGEKKTSMHIKNAATRPLHNTNTTTTRTEKKKSSVADIIIFFSYICRYIKISK